MNLQKLFDMQKGLRNHIGYEGTDRFNKLVLALSVEVGECANEWRGFKFWSNNQEPNTSKPVNTFYGSREGLTTNPLLEEYVDGLHFVLEIGIEIAEEIQFDVEDYFKDILNEIRGKQQCSKTIVEQFNYIFYLTTTAGYDFCFEYLFAAYYHLGELLGFTREEVEQAYMDKNKVNHQRQDNGY